MPETFLVWRNDREVDRRQRISIVPRHAATLPQAQITHKAYLHGYPHQRYGKRLLALQAQRIHY